MSDGSVALRRDSQRGAPALALLSDDRLARLAAKGSTAAFSAIYRRHHQAIYRYCLSIVGNEYDARDALQEAMTSALRAISGEEREISLRPWLFRIAHNEAISVLRKKRRETPVEEVVTEAADGGIGSRDELRELIDDLGLLTERQRSALVMRELSGLSFEEVGHALEVSPEGAKQAVYEARCALQDLRDGRRQDCAEIRSKISAGDRRMLRARNVRAHLRACVGCREFEAEIRARRERFAAIAPLPAPLALGILHGITGGGFGGGGIAAGAVVGAGMAGAAKVGLAGVLVVGVGATALGIRDGGGETRAAADERNAQPASTPPRQIVPAAAVPATGASVDASSKQGDGDGRDADSEPKPAPDGPASTPPGHGGTPPGQGGVPPGLGTAPPGHGGPSPAPAQSTVPSTGSSTEAPGQTGQTPAAGATPPGQTPGATPGNSAQAPGHSGG